MPKIIATTDTLTFKDGLDHFLARWAYRRAYHRVEPGLYSLGKPTPDSPVFVTANYTLSFDALRSNLKGVDCYILVLDTQGINVWCAAGKGTFGTEELMGRIKATGLENVVSHRKVILPQLGAAGVSAFSLKEWCGWQVEYGPIRAEDLKEYLKTHKATPEMRRVRFGLWDRIVLIPVEFVASFLISAVVAILLFLLLGPMAALAATVAYLAGTVLFPALLPWLPTKDFSTKGFILGFVLMLPFAAYVYLGEGTPVAKALAILSYMLTWPPVIAFLALNFTGATTFTSRTGVRKEIYRYIPLIVGVLILGVLANVVLEAALLLKVII
jgi:hypothetical protein